MKRKLVSIILAIVCLVSCVVAFTGCEFLEDLYNNTIGGVVHQENGTYYVYKYEQLDKSTYIKLESGNWVDDDNTKGTYEIDNGNITFYVGNSGLPLVSGTISIGSGKMELNFSLYSSTIYYKEGSQPK